MKLDEIINLINQYLKDPNIISNNNFLNQIGIVIKTLFNNKNIETSNIIIKYNHTIESIIRNQQFIDYYLDDDIIFFHFLCLNLDNLDSLAIKYRKKIVNLLENGNIESWQKDELFSNKNLFNFISKIDRELLIKFNLFEIFKEITLLDIKQYGDIFLRYLENLEYSNISFDWQNNDVLFNYVKENRRELLYKFNLDKFFSEITIDTLNDYNDVILKAIVVLDVIDLPIKWRNSENLFNYLNNDNKRRNLLYKLNLEKFFPKITPNILDDYKEVILQYIYLVPLSSDEWKNSELLFNFLKEHRKDLLYKLNLEKFFPRITPEILEEYEDIILKYIENLTRMDLLFYWKMSKELFEFLKTRRRDLLYKLDIEKIFTEISEDILEEYSDVIIKYIENTGGYGFSDNEILFKYLAEHRRDLLYKLNLEKFFPRITPEILEEYGDVILKHLNEKFLLHKESFLLPELWSDSQALFDYLIDLKSHLLFAIKVGSFIFEDKYLTYFSELYGIDKTEYERKIRNLYEKNDELFKTLNFNILKIEGLNLNLLSRFTLYPKIQERIIELDNIILPYFVKIANTLNTKDSDLSAVIEKILNNINNYRNLLTEISLEDLDLEKIKNLIFILEKKENIFNINNIDDLTNIGFQKKKYEYFNKISDSLEDMDDLDLKDIIFEKLYGIDYDTALFIYERYCHDLKRLAKTTIDSKVLNIITTISKIMKLESIEELRKIYQDIEIRDLEFNFGLTLESLIRKEFAKMYKNTLYQIKDEDKSKNPILQNITYKGKKIQFYEVNDKFNMQVHGLGSYGDWERPSNFKKDWLRPKIARHGICTSYIGNNQIATAPPKAPFLGFSDYEDSALLLSGNFDLGSVNTKFSITTEETKTNFVTPRTMIDSTRHNHNEMVIERMIITQDETLIKRMPSYVVYIVDDINNQYNFSNDNEYYQMVLQASYDFDIPIVIIDRLKFAKREIEKCEILEQTFCETKNTKVLEELFLTYMNNAVGCRQFEIGDKKEYQKIFSRDVIKGFYNRIYSFLRLEYDNLIDEVLDNESIEKLGNNMISLIKLLTFEKTNYELSDELCDSYINLEEAIADIKYLYMQYRMKIKKIATKNSVSNSIRKV